MALSVFGKGKKKPRPIDVDISEFDNLLATKEEPPQLSAPQTGEVMPRSTPGGAIVNIPLGEIAVQGQLKDGTVVTARQGQRTAEDDALRESIRVHGVQVPLIVRPSGPYDSFRYVVAKGTRRYHEAKALGLESVPCMVRNVTRPQATMLSLILTTHSKQLAIHEKGRAVAQVKRDMQAALDAALAAALPGVEGKPTRRQLETMIAEYSDRDVHPEAEPWLLDALKQGRETGRRPKVTWDMMAVQIGVTKQRIRQYLDAAALPPEVHAAIESNELNERQVRALTALPDAATQKRLAREIVQRGLSSAQAAERARQLRGLPQVSNGNNGNNGANSGTSEQAKRAAVRQPSERRDTALRDLREAARLLHGASGELLKLRESDGELAPLLCEEIAGIVRDCRAELKRLDEVF